MYNDLYGRNFLRDSEDGKIPSKRATEEIGNQIKQQIADLSDDEQIIAIENILVLLNLILSRTKKRVEGVNALSYNLKYANNTFFVANLMNNCLNGNANAEEFISEAIKYADTYKHNIYSEQEIPVETLAWLEEIGTTRTETPEINNGNVYAYTVPNPLFERHATTLPYSLSELANTPLEDIKRDYEVNFRDNSKTN